MITAIRAALAPYYLYIKFAHVFFVMIWIWSTAVAYAFYLVPIFKAWRRNPTDPEIRTLRNWAMERFDQGVIYEHIAFPMILLTGPLLYFLAGFSTSIDWLLLKLLIVTGVLIPLEVFDYYLSHFGGNKRRVRESATRDTSGSHSCEMRYERAVHHHWWFLLVSSPAVMIFATLVVFLAIAKPF